MLSAVLNKDTGKLMEYRKLMKKPKHRHLYRNSYAKEIGLLSQGMAGLVECTNTIFLIYKQAIPVDRFKDITYGRVGVDYFPDKINP